MPRYLRTYLMNDNVIFTDSDKPDITENTDLTGNKTVTDYTQVASVAQGGEYVPERRRQSLRARLEREKYERDQQLANSFITTFRSLFSTTRH